MHEDKLIETVALVHIRHHRLLLVRPYGKSVFYMPGGKRAPGENDEVALVREVREELGSTVLAHTIHHYGVFEDRAYGQPDGTQVRIACYLGELDKVPTPMAEIAEFRYFSHGEYKQMPDTAPAVQRIMGHLRDQSLIK